MQALGLRGGARTLPVWAVLAFQAFEYVRFHQQPAAPLVCAPPEAPALGWEVARELAHCRSELAVALTCPAPPDLPEDEKAEWSQGLRTSVLAAVGSLCGTLVSWILRALGACCCRDVEEAGREEARHEDRLLKGLEVSPTHRGRARGQGVVR